MKNQIYRDFDAIFRNINVQTKFPYNNEDYNILIYGYISLNNAKKRLNQNEYYPVVKYSEGEELPEAYIPLSSVYLQQFNLKDDKFATINPKIPLNRLCADGILYPIIRTSSSKDNSRYHLGSEDGGALSLETIIYCILMEYISRNPVYESENKKLF